MSGLRIGRPPQSLSEKFFRYVRVGVDGDCWLWAGTKQRQGYGNIKENGKILKAHRVSWMIHRGQIPDGLCVCHTCDTPSCVNPNHLFLGTYQDNITDRTRKGRGPNQHGERNHRAKLTASDIVAIRNAVGTHKEIAKRFGICRQNVGFIRANKTWSVVS